MEVEPGEVSVGLMMTVFGFAGLVLAAGAHDNEMYVFGLSLVGFAFVFVLGLVRCHYDRVPNLADVTAGPAAPSTATAPAQTASVPGKKVPAYV